MHRREQLELAGENPEDHESTQHRPDDRAEESLPGFARADVRDHLVFADQRPGYVGTHVGEFRDDEHEQKIETASRRAGASILG